VPRHCRGPPEDNRFIGRRKSGAGMTNAQLYLVVGLPVLAVLIGILVNGLVTSTLAGRIGAVEARQSNLENRQTNVENRIDSLRDRIDARFDKLDAKFDILTGKVIEIDNRLIRVEERLDHLEKR
jgi:flagellar capping protein FliD